jgi:uncharacterized FlaG/YvyC family protein
MNIPPLSGPLGIPPTVPTAEEVTRSVGITPGQTPEVRRIEPVQPAAASDGTKEQSQPQADTTELRSLANQMGLQVRLDTLPDSNITLYRFVEPMSGEVVREFPPENLAKELQELRRLAASRLDRKV